MEDQVEQGLHRESEQLAQLDHLKKEVHERDSEIEALRHDLSFLAD